MKSVALLMSGGIDSSVAACLLQEQGMSVTGVHLKLFSYRSKEQKETSWHKVQEVSRILGINCVLLDLETYFKEQIVDFFVSSYQNGITPNPCVKCNRTIKFGAFYSYARDVLKADFISSGHYAKLKHVKGSIQLFKAEDSKKDQTYFLYQLNQPLLQHLVFPLGELTKPEVRTLAKKYSLAMDFGKESEDVCFIPQDFQSFIREQIEDNPGDIVDSHGTILGKHNGCHYFTIGQRQGLGIANPDPLYVIDLNREHNTVIVGTRDEAYQTELYAEGIQWIAGVKPSDSIELKAKVRYRGEEKSCRIQEEGEYLHITFHEPIFAITKGQSIVFYQENQILGGGIICSSRKKSYVKEKK